MAAVAAPKNPPKRRRGGLRLLIVLGILVLLIAGGVVWLNVSAQAAVSVSGSLTVYQPVASIAHNSGAAAEAKTGATVQAGDKVSTDAKGLAAVTLPDGTVTRLATNTTLTLDSAHFTKNGNQHDVKFTQEVGRTFTNVQHLVTGATFEVHGKSATASVRGTKFEVYLTPDGKMLVKLFQGTLDFIGKNTVHLVAPQQATADAQGNVGPAGPIVPDPNDPFGPEVDASNAVEVGTTPGTEQDFTGPPLHDGETQTFSYSYTGGSAIKASLGYPGSLMSITLKSPSGESQSKTDKSPVTVQFTNAPAGIYTVVVTGVSKLGAAGESPFVAVASIEDCKSAIPGTNQNGAVHRAYTGPDLVAAVEGSGGVSGLSNLSITLADNSISGAIISATGTYNGASWSGSVVIVARNGVLVIMPTSGHVFGLDVPAQQIVQQVAAAIGQDPSNVNPGFVVDRLFTCNTVMMVDGRMS
jgi:hypothetical protein